MANPIFKMGLSIPTVRNSNSHWCSPSNTFHIISNSPLLANHIEKITIFTPTLVLLCYCNDRHSNNKYCDVLYLWQRWRLLLELCKESICCICWCGITWSWWEWLRMVEKWALGNGNMKEMILYLFLFCIKIIGWTTFLGGEGLSFWY